MRWMRPAIVAAVLVAALATAGVALATVTYTPSTGTLFIGRGDVISSAGKDALVPNPDVVWSASWTWTFLCKYADGRVVQEADLRGASIEYHAVPRYA